MSLFLRAPGNVVRPRCCTVLVNQLLDHFARVVQLVKVLLEYVLFAELLQEGFTLTQFVVLPACPLEQLWDRNRENFQTLLCNFHTFCFVFNFSITSKENEIYDFTKTPLND